MGVLACLLFGILAAWIIRSVLVRAGIGGVKSVFVIGLLGGMIGLTGVLIGFGDLEHFNLYNVLIAISASVLISIGWAKVQPDAVSAATE